MSFDAGAFCRPRVCGSRVEESSLGGGYRHAFASGADCCYACFSCSTGAAGAGLGDLLEGSEEATAHADTSVSMSQPTDNAPRGGAATESERARGESPSVPPSASVNQCSAEVLPLDIARFSAVSTRTHQLTRGGACTWEAECICRQCCY